MYNYERMRKRSPHNSKGSAEAFEAYLRQLVAQHGSVEKAEAAMEAKPEARAQVPTLAEFSERWLRYYVDVNNKPSEQYTKRRVLRCDLLPFFGTHQLDKIGAAEIERYKESQQRRGLSNKTINNSLTILRKCIATAVDWEITERIPRFKFLKLPPLETKVVEPEDVTRLLAACAEPWRTFVLMALRAGLRFNELIALRWCDLDLGTATLNVRQGEFRGHVGTPKTRKSVRSIPLTSDLVEAICRLPRIHERVFTHKGQPVRYGSAWWYLSQACKRAGIPHTSWHSLRHTFATELNAHGAYITTIQDLLGHENLTMTLRYTHPVTSVHRAAIALLEPKPQIVLSTCCHPTRPEGQNGGPPENRWLNFSSQPSENTALEAVLSSGSS